MLPESEQDIFGRGTTAKRFSARDARRILDLAAEEQSRRDRALDGSYSLEELEEIASEAGIAPDALHAAIRDPAKTSGVRRRKVRPSRLSVGAPALLMGVAGITLLALLFTIPEFAYAFAAVAVLLLMAALIAA